jgi:hypothetical protein
LGMFLPVRNSLRKENLAQIRSLSFGSTKTE